MNRNGENNESNILVDIILLDDNAMNENENKNKYWKCQECGYVSHKPFPEDREKFYKNVEIHGCPQCPKCKSSGFMPVGF